MWEDGRGRLRRKKNGGKNKVLRRKENSSLRAKTRSINHPITIRCPRYASPTICTGQFLQESYFRDKHSRGQYRKLQESWFSTKNKKLSSNYKYSSQLSSHNSQSRNKTYLLSKQYGSREKRGCTKIVAMTSSWLRERRGRSWIISWWPPFDAHPIVFAAKQQSRACAFNEENEELSRKKERKINWKVDGC